MRIRYECEGCDSQYDTENEAQECERRSESDPQRFFVGDIVTICKEFGWYDGERAWVVDPNAEKLKKLLFYYVVSLVDREEHRARYHLVTLAMSGKQGYRSGFTFNEHHLTPEKVTRPPAEVLEQARTVIGTMTKELI